MSAAKNVVAATHTSNAIGTVVDLAPIVAAATTPSDIYPRPRPRDRRTGFVASGKLEICSCSYTQTRVHRTRTVVWAGDHLQRGPDQAVIADSRVGETSGHSQTPRRSTGRHSFIDVIRASPEPYVVCILLLSLTTASVEIPGASYVHGRVVLLSSNRFETTFGPARGPVLVHEPQRCTLTSI